MITQHLRRVPGHVSSRRWGLSLTRKAGWETCLAHVPDLGPVPGDFNFWACCLLRPISSDSLGDFGQVPSSVWINFFSFLVVLRLQPRASHLLGEHSTTSFLSLFLSFFIFYFFLF